MCCHGIHLYFQRAMLLLETFLVRSDAVSLDYVVSACQHQLVNLFQSSADQRIKDKAGKVKNRQSCLLFVFFCLCLCNIPQ